MTGKKHFELINKDQPCPECGIHAPQRQINNLGMCERCSLEGKVKDGGKTLNPEKSLYDKWRYETPKSKIQSEGRA